MFFRHCWLLRTWRNLLCVVFNVEINCSYVINNLNFNSHRFLYFIISSPNRHNDVSDKKYKSWYVVMSICRRFVHHIYFSRRLNSYNVIEYGTLPSEKTVLCSHESGKHILNIAKISIYLFFFYVQTKITHIFWELIKQFIAWFFSDI